MESGNRIGVNDRPIADSITRSLDRPSPD